MSDNQKDKNELILPPIVNIVQQREIHEEKNNINNDNTQEINDIDIDNDKEKIDNNKEAELAQKKEQYKEEINRLKQDQKLIQ